jgi:hypothetical protein
MAIITGPTWKIGAVTEKPRSCQAFSSCNRPSKVEPVGDVFSMPFYTYIVNYKGNNHALQQMKGSNFQGNWSWIGEIPEAVFPRSKHQELAGKVMRAQFEPVSNRKHVWSKAVEIDDSLFTVFAIQTVP